MYPNDTAEWTGFICRLGLKKWVPVSIVKERKYQRCYDDSSWNPIEMCPLIVGGGLVVRGRVSIVGQGSLQIEGLGYSDSGSYQCTASNGQGKPVKVGAKISVLGKCLLLSCFVLCGA